MAKYCTKCGTKIENNKRCFCEEQRGEIEQNIVIDFWKKPFDILNHFKGGNQSFFLIGILSLLIGFIINEQVVSSHSPYMILIPYPYCRNLIVYSSLIAGSILLFNVMIQVFTKLCLKKDLTFSSLIDISAVSIIPMLYTAMASLLCYWMFGFHLFMINWIGLLAFSILYFSYMSKKKEIDQNKFIYIFLISFSIVLLFWI